MSGILAATRSVDRNAAQQREIAEHFSSAQHNRGERVVGDRNGQAGFLADALVEILDERAAAGEHDATVADVGGKLRWGALERDADGVDDGRDIFGERFADFAVVNRDRARHALDQVAAFDFEGHRLFERVRRANFDFDLFGGALTDEQVIFPFQVVHYGFVHFVSGDADRTRIDDSAHGDDSDVRGAAADIDDHVSGGLLDGQAGADGGSHGLFDEIDFAGASAIGGVLHGAFFNRRDFAGNSDNDPWMNENAAIVGLLNEVGEHFFGHLEIGDYPVLHRFDGHHVARSSSEHFLGLAADGHYFTVRLINGDDGRLVHDDAFAAGEDECVRRSEVDGQVRRE